MSVRVTLDKAEVKARIEAAEKKAIPIIANEFLKNANYFCREDSSTLIKSSILASDLENGNLVWNTDYARKVYYTGIPSTDTNPEASLMWAHKAHTLYGKKYERMYNKIIKETV
jgi:hypothetical protein